MTKHQGIIKNSWYTEGALKARNIRKDLGVLLWAKSDFDTSVSFMSDTYITRLRT